MIRWRGRISYRVVQYNAQQGELLHSRFLIVPSTGCPKWAETGFCWLGFRVFHCPTLLGLMGIWQKRLGSWARWWNTEIKVNPTQVSAHLGHPVDSWQHFISDVIPLHGLEQNGVGSRTYNDPLTSPTPLLTVPGSGGGGGDDGIATVGVIGKRKSEKVDFCLNFSKSLLH